MRPRLRFLVAASHRLEYRWIPATRRDAPPLVLLHEGLGSMALWGDFPDRLAALIGSGALIYSRYGFGRSEPLREPRTSDYLEREAVATRHTRSSRKSCSPRWRDSSGAFTLLPIPDFGQVPSPSSALSAASDRGIEVRPHAG
jgi:pimeloyl-ACP methyl ester carboxylesterase